MANLQQAAAQAAQAAQAGGGGGGGGEQLPDPQEIAAQIVQAGGPEYAMQLIAALEAELQGGGGGGAAPAAPAAPAEAVASSGRISAQQARGQLS